jgi:hypothetical protein
VVAGLGLEFPPMMQRPSEFACLITTVERNLGRAPRSVLEIGTWQGGTISRFGARWPEAELFVVDPQPFPSDPDGISLANLTVVRGFSQDEAVREEVARLHPEPFDLVHIDGDHSYGACEADYAWALSGLKARMIALHDIAPWGGQGQGTFDVWKLWHEIKLSGIPALEIRHDPDCLYGIGIVMARG